MQLPSAKVGFTLVVVSITVGLIIIMSTVYDRFFEGKTNSKNNQKNLSVEIKDVAILDTDKDGLTDWEETLWGTEINKADTDNDGTNDGQEVSLNRNPKLAGPNDGIIDLDEYVENFKPLENFDETSLTNAVAQNLFTNFINISQGGTQIGAENTQKLVESIVSNAANQINITDKYNVNNLTTFDSKNTEKLKDYGNKFVQYQYEELLSLVQNKATNGGGLDPIISTYQKMAQRISVMQVPEELKNVHNSATNNLYKISVVLENMKKSDTDPMLAMMFIPQYEKIANDQELLTSQIGTFLKQSGIIYEEGEPGNLLFNSNRAVETDQNTQ